MPWLDVYCELCRSWVCLVPENLNVAAADDLRRMHNEHFAPQVLDN
eukprot:COSAG01_NODE_42562_length_438_cov_16.469027_1_plen_45_part_10